MPEPKEANGASRPNGPSNNGARHNGRGNAPQVDYNPQSLVGQISVKEMGSRAAATSTEVARVTPGSAPLYEVNRELDIAEFHTPASFLDGSLENITYKPSTAANAEHFSQLVVEVRNHIPDESRSVILSAADAILEVLKNEETPIGEKRAEIEQLLSMTLTDIQMADLMSLAKQITDFGDQKESDTTEENEAVAVVFEEDEAEAKPAALTIDVEATESAPVEENVTIDIGDSSATVTAIDTKTTTIALKDITKDFLFSKISTLEPDWEAEEVREKCKSISKLLYNEKLSTEELQSAIMEVLNFQHLEFVKLCISERWKIVYGLKLLSNREKAIQEIKEKGLDSLLVELGLLSKKRKNLDSDAVDAKRTKSTSSKREPQIVDLQGLVFEQGPQLMASTKITLPKGSYQQNKKLYDIITVPAPSGPPSLEESGDRLVSISEMPEWAQAAFPAGETTTLNRIQSKIYPAAFQSDENLLLCAPTGAGKTNVAMLAFLRVLLNHRDPNTGRFNLKNFKAVYVAPLKALVSEQMREFQRRLTAQFGVVVNELTGDLSLSQKEIAETQVLVTTPEKWDVVSRKATEDSYARLVKLLIIDEIHLLHDDRGPVLESIIIRAKRRPETRLVGLSATLPNYADVAQFLDVNRESGLYYFDSLYRPCPLEQQYIGIKEKKAIKKVAAMNEACYEKMVECIKNGHQLIIFVHSRKDTVKTAKWLANKASENDVTVLRPGAGTREILKLEADNALNKNVAEILPSGFGVHHAGLNKEDRSVIEDLFAQGHIQVLVSTATLAWGVNLPAHTVIIKGTDTYNPEKGAWVQLSPQDILQMLGRAGRPRYDKSGEGVIITAQEELQYYLAILNQQLPIESQFMSRLADNLNAEIVLGNVKSRADAVEWLGQTYLYIRMLKSPKLYQVGAEYESDSALVWKRDDLIHSALTILHEHKLVFYDVSSGHISSNELGKIASHFYIGYETMGIYNTKLKPWMTEIDVLKVFASSGEFTYVPVRQEEKQEVAKLADKCPIPIKEAASDPKAKISVLLQAYISGLQLDGFALMADMIYVSQSAGRLLRAIHEITLKKKWAQLALITLDLCKVASKRMWNTSSPFRQFGNLASKEIIRATEASHLPFISYFQLDAAELSEAINFKGHSLQAHKLLQLFPKLSIDCVAQPISSSMIRVLVEVLPDWEWNFKLHGNSELFLLTVGDCDGDNILYDQIVKINQKHVNRGFLMSLTVPASDPLAPTCYVTLTSEKWLHSQWRAPVKMFDLRLPKTPSALTDLLDVQSVPTSALKSEDLSNTFEFNYFNKFQSQCFHALWNTNENVFIGASKGCGKRACAELAILNCWRQNKQKVLYLQPNQEMIDKKVKIWEKKYATLTEPPKKIAKLTGELTADLKIMAQSHLVLCTPEQFDTVSRRWRQRKAIQSLDVVIADELQLVANGAPGVIYETVLARLRFMSAHLEREMRIAALGLPIIYGREVGEWLGCTKRNIFNFNPNQRVSTILEIKLQPYTEANFSTALASPCIKQITDSRKQTLAFVSSKKIGVELIRSLLADDNFGSQEKSEIFDSLVDKIQDGYLQKLLKQGTGLYHLTMIPRDRAIVEKLFGEKLLRVLIATKETAAYCPRAEQVIIYGTQTSDAIDHTDYKLSEFLEMVGCCENGNVLAYVHGPKVQYYSTFLTEPLPVESNLNVALHDSFVHEISTRTFQSKQDCIDWLTYTLFYRRLTQNPSYYGLTEVTHVGISEYLSELVETTLTDLSDAGLVELGEAEVDDEEEEDTITPLNGAVIASHYGVSFSSMKTFTELTGTARLRNIIEAVTASSEFDSLPIREQEDNALIRISTQVPLKVANDTDFNSPQVKAFLLLQAHLSRLPLSGDLQSDQREILSKVMKLVNACTDTLSSEGHLSAMQAMDLSQMIVQGMWNRDSPIRQIPHVSDAMLERCKKYDVETVYDIMSLEDDERDDVLQMEGDKLHDVAEFVNKYPNVDVLYEIDLDEPVKANEPHEISVVIERDEEMEDLEVVSLRFPFAKTEGWWVVVGDAATRQLYAIKKLQVASEHQKVTLEVTLPTAGHHKLTIWCMCDSYIDADKEMELEVDVAP